jgi:hypothetical protein
MLMSGKTKPDVTVRAYKLNQKLITYFTMHVAGSD